MDLGNGDGAVLRIVVGKQRGKRISAALLMLIFLSAHPSLGSYEPFAMMFSLEGAGIQWFILPIALIGSFFTSAFWCRYFCPCGHGLTQVVRIRKAILKPFKKRRAQVAGSK